MVLIAFPLPLTLDTIDNWYSSNFEDYPMNMFHAFSQLNSNGAFLE